MVLSFCKERSNTSYYTKMEARPTEVAGKPMQAGEIRSRWEWTEPSVWTENMLTALEKGVKGGKWFSLIDAPS
jgi:hypothetical protein